MSKHTPGPWEFKPIPADYAFRAPDNDDAMILSPNGVCPGTVWSYGEEGVANARLIAAAPELYAALKALYENLGETDEEGLIGHSPLMDAAYKALEKARGK